MKTNISNMDLRTVWECTEILGHSCHGHGGIPEALPLDGNTVPSLCSDWKGKGEVEHQEGNRLNGVMLQ